MHLPVGLQMCTGMFSGRQLWFSEMSTKHAHGVQTPAVPPNSGWGPALATVGDIVKVVWIKLQDVAA